MSLKDFLLGILKSINIKALLYGFYKNNLRPELEKLVASTSVEWDNMALAAVDMLIEKFLGSDASAKAVAIASLKQVAASHPA